MSLGQRTDARLEREALSRGGARLLDAVGVFPSQRGFTLRWAELRHGELIGDLSAGADPQRPVHTQRCRRFPKPATSRRPARARLFAHPRRHLRAGSCLPNGWRRHRSRREQPGVGRGFVRIRRGVKSRGFTNTGQLSGADRRRVKRSEAAGLAQSVARGLSTSTTRRLPSATRASENFTSLGPGGWVTTLKVQHEFSPRRRASRGSDARRSFSNRTSATPDKPERRLNANLSRTLPGSK